MFQLGSSLRQARLDRGLGLAEVEAQTKIRGRYLAALEDERFDVLPAGSYAKHFVRAYADFLGLDGDVYAEELAGKLPEDEPPVVHASVQRRRRFGRPRTSVLVVLGAVVVLVVVLAAGGFGSGHKTPAEHVVGLQSKTTGSPVHRARHRTAPAVVTVQKRAKPAPSLARLRLLAARGDCWLQVRVGSASGPVLYEGVLAQGHALRYTRPSLWLRIGAPSALEATLNGKPLASLPTSTGNVLVTPRGAAAA
jgi:hypothetical protein